MPKKGISRSRGRPGRTAPELDLVRFIGLSLGGGKVDKACLAVVDFYPEANKIFLAQLFEKIKSEGEVSADQQIVEKISGLDPKPHSVALDSPLSLPLCLTCSLECPGFERCREPHITWAWEHFRRYRKAKKPRKLFTPYTQRSVEMFVHTQLEESFAVSHALGANAAPLTARALFLARRLDLPCIEVFPRLSLWRWGRQLKISKAHLRSHKHSTRGSESRGLILDAMMEGQNLFLYHQDVRSMISNNHAFEAFLCALTACWAYQGKTQERPTGFPEDEAWIAFPQE